MSTAAVDLPEHPALVAVTVVSKVMDGLCLRGSRPGLAAVIDAVQQPDGSSAGLWSLPGDDVAELVRRVVGLQARLDGVLLAAVREADVRGLHGDLGLGSAAQWLRLVARIELSEAKALVEQAAALAPGLGADPASAESGAVPTDADLTDTDLTDTGPADSAIADSADSEGPGHDEREELVRPLVAIADRAGVALGRELAGGRVTRAQAAVITRAVAALPHDTDPAQLLYAEALLAGYARTLTARQLGRAGAKLAEVLGALRPDSDDPDEAAAAEREAQAAARADERALALYERRDVWWHTRADGMVEGGFRLDPVTAAPVITFLEAARRVNDPDHAAGNGPEHEHASGNGPGHEHPGGAQGHAVRDERTPWGASHAHRDAGGHDLADDAGHRTLFDTGSRAPGADPPEDATHGEEVEPPESARPEGDRGAESPSPAPASPAPASPAPASSAPASSAPASASQAASSSAWDGRTQRQRTADALAQLCLHGLNGVVEGVQLPQHGASRPHVAVTMDLAALQRQVAAAGTLDLLHSDLAPQQLRALACDARVIPVVLGGLSQPLDVGRASRTATPAQRRALALRDRGCSMPGCDVPPAGCIAHHIRWWSHGGSTDLRNLALLCPTHHTAVHLQCWHVGLAGDGVVELTAPTWLDPDGTARHHERHTGRRVAPRTTTPAALPRGERPWIPRSPPSVRAGTACRGRGTVPP